MIGEKKCLMETVHEMDEIDIANMSTLDLHTPSEMFSSEF